MGIEDGPYHQTDEPQYESNIHFMMSAEVPEFPPDWE